MSSEKKSCYFDKKDYQNALIYSDTERHQSTLHLRPSASLQLMCLFFLTQFLPVAFAEDKFYFKDDQGTYYYVTSVIGEMSASIYNYLNKGQCHAGLSFDVGADQYPYTLISQLCAKKTVEPQLNPQRYIKIYCQSGKFPNTIFKECIETFFARACQEHYDNEFWQALPIVAGIFITALILTGIFLYCQSNTSLRTMPANMHNPFRKDKLINAECITKLLDELSSLFNQGSTNADLSIMDKIINLKKEVIEFKNENTCAISQDIIEDPIAASSGIYFNGEHLWDHIRHRRKTCPATRKPLAETLEHFPNVNVDKKNQINEGLKNLGRKVEQLKAEISALLTTETTLSLEPAQELHRRIVR